MKTKFIGRKEFLNKLKKQVDTDEMSFSLIYGRRRVGKSELVKETLRCANEKSIYFECKQVAEESNVASLSAIVSDVMGLPKLGYVLRHTFCTRICENETNLRVIMDIMGHSDIQTTMNIYAEVTGVKKQESMMALSDKILV